MKYAPFVFYKLYTWFIYNSIQERNLACATLYTMLYTPVYNVIYRMYTATAEAVLFNVTRALLTGSVDVEVLIVTEGGGGGDE